MKININFKVMCKHGRIKQLSKIMNENNLKKDQGNVGTKKIRS